MVNFDVNEPIYSIGIAAKKLKISVPALRVYEREGLLIPHRTETGRRIYSHKDIERIGIIRKMIQNEGLNFEGIRRILSLIPCWRLKACPVDVREKCSAFFSSNEPCWKIKNNNSDICTEECRTCIVFKKGYEKFNNLKSLLKELCSCI
ncbi:MerR family transcriptional regulator [candidate division KSB1 bacterium]|nr:MAG: MerR family transcriptional regulator [candidate division KSB1 bacterium]